MKLIYANGACSLAVHILLEELGATYEAIRVSLQDKKVLESYNSLGYVPAIVLGNGQVMTEAISILQYLSTENEFAFMPQENFGRARCIEWLTYISTEIHKGATPLFYRSGLKEDFLKEVNDRLEKRLQVLEYCFQDNAFLMGERYTVADMYALAILRILEHVQVTFDHFPAITDYKKKLEERPVIKKVLALEESAALETKLREFSVTSQAYTNTASPTLNT